MTAHTGWAVARDSSGNGSTPKGTRLAMGGLVAPDGSGPLGVRRGVFADTLDPVASGTGAMAYEVRPFRAVTMTATTNGPVLVANDAVVTVPTDPAPGSGSRWDRLYVRQHLVAGDGGSDPDVQPEIGVVKGQASGSPVVPSLPAGALPLGRALVTAGASSTAGLAFTRDHDWTVANGGIVPDGNGGGLWWDGDAWVPVADGRDSGWVNLGFSSNYEAENPGTYGPVTARRVGKRVFLQGNIRRVGTANFPASAVTRIATVPSTDGAGRSLRPIWTKDTQAAGHTAATDAKVRVEPNGAVSIITGPSVPAYITLGDVSYFID